MKNLLILTLAAVMLLTACVHHAPKGESTGELCYTVDRVSPSDRPDGTEPQTEALSEPESASSDTGDASESTVTESEAKSEPVTEPEAVHVSGITLTVYELWLRVGESFMPIVTMSPENAADKGEEWTSSDTTVATVDPYGNIFGVSEGECTVTVTSTDNADVSAQVKLHVLAKETESETASSTDPEPDLPASDNGLTYINGILVVNKTYSLPEDYNPGVDPTAQEALYAMFADAAKEGLSLWVKSGVRTYADQKWQYNVYAERDGKELADTYSARPGHSEHQTGLAFDLNSLYKSFADTPEGKWLAANCHRYGFIIRYPAGKEHLTGYMYEPWHVRYVGTEHAAALYESGLCLEEYLGITSVYSY